MFHPRKKGQGGRKGDGKFNDMQNQVFLSQLCLNLLPQSKGQGSKCVFTGVDLKRDWIECVVQTIAGLHL